MVGANKLALALTMAGRLLARLSPTPG